MKLLHRYNFLLASAFYCLLFFLFLPLHRYVFDVDGTGYSSVAQHLAAGSFERAVNGFWSPLHSWLVTPFIKSGISIQLLFFYSNAVISIVILFLINRLCFIFSIAEEWITAILFTTAILLLQFSFHELAADILVLPFLLGWLLLMLRTDFYTNYKIHFYCGLLVGFGYLAKTYTLPFLSVIHLVLLLQYFYFKKQPVVKPVLYFFIALAFVCIPWILIISNKYGYFTIGNSSRLNLSWFLRGMTNDSAFFHPPTYSDSFGWWEDPSYYGGEVVNLFSSGVYFLKQVKVVLHNAIVFGKLLFQISFLVPVIILLLFYNARKKKVELFNKLSVFLILFPAGYLLTFVDGRYLWIFNLIFLPAGFVLLYQFANKFKFNSSLRLFIYFIYFLSFTIFPVFEAKQNVLNPQWKEIHDVAAWLKQHHISQNFTSNKKSAQTQVIAYLSGARHFQLSNINVSKEQLAQAMEENKIPVLLYYYEQENQKQTVINYMLQLNYTGQSIQPGIYLFFKNK